MNWDLLSTRSSQWTAVAVGVVFLCFAGCRGRATPDANPSEEIIVAAAANLTDAFEELTKEFTRQTGTRVVLSFGSTADLARQIENGAPFDVYAAADVAHVEGLDRKGLLTPGTNRVYARGSLVVWVPSGSLLNLTRVEDLTRKEYERVAIAKPDIAPYGEAALETLRALKIWEQIEPKVVYGMNVSQVKQFVSSGNAEVAFLPRALLKPGDGHFIEISESLHRPIDQALGVVKASAKQNSARQFADFIMSAEGQTLLKKYGYKEPS
ncbi:MAG TPA: molybdate ABC transporter substrate-binding protein [Pyrinomonadaceae bacterium]|nr:molybdate ABC transporter substrate-binding protein [Pyrinomonadaceae bacterium]